MYEAKNIKLKLLDIIFRCCWTIEDTCINMPWAMHTDTVKVSYSTTMVNLIRATQL